jgi:zona occludens toxin (predicted ATPase)
MARRASFAIHPLWIVAVLLLAIGAISVGNYLVGRVNDPYRTLATLDVPAYLENSNSLRGNSYKISGSIWNYLSSSTKEGRLFSVEVNNGSATEVLPVLVPGEFNNINIQKGQHFNFSVEVDEKGILTVKGLTKA